jgi:O-antigen/teichoic acid export membrane protein
MEPPGQSARPIRGLETVVGDFVGVTGARVATLALGMLTVVLTARVLTPAGYAVIAYMTLGGTLIMFVASGWSGAAVMRYGREELDRSGSMRTTAWARAALTVPTLVFSSALLPILKLAGVLPQEFSWTYLWLTVALGFFFVGGEQLQVVLDAAGRMRLSAAAAAARQALLVAGLAVIAISGAGRSTLTVGWLTVAVAALLMFALASALRGLALWPPRLDREQLRRIFVFSAPLIAFTASQYGMRSVDIVVLRAYGTAEDVGTYALAYQSFTMLQTLAVTVSIVLIPLFVSLREAGREELVDRYLERLVPQGIFVSSVLGGLMAPLVVVAVPLVFGAEFEDAGAPLALLVGALVLFAVTSLLAPILMLHERTRETSLINVAALLLNIVADIVLVGVFDTGVVGPAIATLATLVVIVAGYLLVACSDRKTRPVLSPALALPLATGLLPALLIDGALGPALGLAGAIAATALILWRLSLFTAQDADLLARLDLPAPIRARVVAAVRRLARA